MGQTLKFVKSMTADSWGTWTDSHSVTIQIRKVPQDLGLVRCICIIFMGNPSLSWSEVVCICLIMYVSGYFAKNFSIDRWHGAHAFRCIYNPSASVPWTRSLFDCELAHSLALNSWASCKYMNSAWIAWFHCQKTRGSLYWPQSIHLQIDFEFNVAQQLQDA